MDDIILRSLLDEDDVLEDIGPAAFLSVIAHGVEQARRRSVARRRPNRLYLCRRQLCPDPRRNTPWQCLSASRDDRAFITTMGFDVTSFQYILDSGFTHLWNTTPIPRYDTSSSGAPRIHARSLDAAGGLGLVLHYLGSSMLETSLQQIFAIIPSTVSRYLEFGQDILLQVFQGMKEGQLKWWDEDELEEDTGLIQVRHPLLEGAVGGVDGLSLPCQVSEDPEMENATYNSWKSDHCITNILVSSPRGVFTYAQINAPGSWHDAHTARPMFRKLHTQMPEGYYIVADTAFPRGKARMSGKLRTPLKSGGTITTDARQQREILAFNRQLLSYRQTTEWGMCALQGGFGRLRVPLPVQEGWRRRRLLELCIRGHNVRTICVGINQIRSVYMPLWRETEDEHMWSDLKNVLFGTIRHNDRVRRFHLVVE